MDDLISGFGLDGRDLGHLTAAVQFGFISGTLLFAVLSIADRFSPSKTFLVSALLGALFNIGIIWDGNSISSLLFLRFFTGFFLAGIYPVGMKIAADYYKKGLGKALGFLVGALVVGTALPHLIKDVTDTLSWKVVILTTSSLAVLGGLLMFIMIPDGPYRKAGQRLDFTGFYSVFKNEKFRAAAFGYFGHMWELYAFWAFVPIMLKTYNAQHSQIALNIPMLSFLIIGIGGLACVLGGFLAEIVGTKKTAFTALLLSCACCLLSPMIFSTANESLFLGFLLFWGMVVIADSPLFSTLVAQNVSAEFKGTALVIVNCIGFSITIISIQLITFMSEMTNSYGIYSILAFGPVLGLLALKRKFKSDPLVP